MQRETVSLVSARPILDSRTDKAYVAANLAWLATQGIKLTNHFAVTHPSQPNYVAAVGGDYFGMDHNGFTMIDRNVSSIVDLLEAKGISWGEYQEDMPYSGFQGSGFRNPLTGANDYVRKHNPAIQYDSVAAHGRRLAQTKNLTLFARELAAGTLPQWLFITPNMTSDGHDTSVTTAGAWTRAFLAPLLGDRRFMNRTLVLVTFDENATYARQNRVLGLLLGDAVPAALRGTADAAFYNHYSEIASVAANWDLHTLGRWDVGANVWQFVADQTGDKVRPWAGAVPLSQMYWNESYDGALYDEGESPFYPRPNLSTGRNGRSVLPEIARAWKGSNNPPFYEDKIEVPDGRHPAPGSGFR